MNKVGYVAPRKGGKTDFIITMIQEEFAQGHKCYYLGGDRHYKEIVEKLKERGCKAIIEFVTKEVTPTEKDCAVFTDNITWEITSIFPFAVRAMTKLSGNWYYTIPKEEVVVLEENINTEAHSYEA